MGRYDNIRVYDGSSWVRPSQIYVYNNGWKSLGTNTGSNQYSNSGYVRHLYCDKYSSGDFQSTRVTLEKRTSTVTNYTYSTGSGKTGTSNYCWNPSFVTCSVEGTFRKTAAYDQNLFYTRDNNGADANSFYFTWLADGRIRLRTSFEQYSGYSDRYSTNAYGTNEWHKIKVIATPISNVNWSTYLYVDDQLVDSWRAGYAFDGINKMHKIGDTYMQMKDDFNVSMQEGGTYNSSGIYLNMSNNNSGYGFGYAEDTSTSTSWI